MSSNTWQVANKLSPRIKFTDYFSLHLLQGKFDPLNDFHEQSLVHRHLQACRLNYETKYYITFIFMDKSKVLVFRLTSSQNTVIREELTTKFQNFIYFVVSNTNGYFTHTCSYSYLCECVRVEKKWLEIGRKYEYVIRINK